MKDARRSRLDPRVAAALAGAAALILAVGFAALREQRGQLEAGDWASHATHVQQQIARLLQHLTEAETAQRGYVLTGDQEYLGPYRRAAGAVPQALDRLRKLTRDNQSQLGRLDVVAPLVAAKLEEMRLVISQRESGDEAGALDTIRTGIGKDVMDRIRAELAATARKERRALRHRLAIRQQRAANAARLILAGSATTLLLMAAAAAVLSALLRRAQAAEARHRESQERLRITLRSIGDAVIATDTEELIVFMNPVAESLTGWREDEGRGRRLDEVFCMVDADTRELAENPAARVLRDGVVVALANRTLLPTREGREVPVDACGAPIRDAEGVLMGVVLVFRDVAERQAAESERRHALWSEAARVEVERTAQALAAARAEADRANEAKDAFLAILSHELRSPLSAMLAWVGILRRRSDDPATRERALAVLERSVRTQTQLINGLLDVSRIASGKLRLEHEPVDFVAELRECLEGLQPAADSKGVTLERELCGGPLVVLGDEARLEQVVRNLVDNAVKFTPAGGRVRVRLAQVGRDAELTVSDTGEGFLREQREVIFDRFQQSSSLRTRRHGGLGLGLAIVRHLVEEHGGTVAADSPGPRRGATFTVRLPLAPGRTPRRGLTPRTDESPVDLSGISVLLVEDDVDWRDAVALRLSQSGATVTTAGSVAEALELLDTARPQVLVSDIGMPGADGYELIRRVRARPGPAVRAVAMTGFADAESRERSLRVGFDDFLAKPFDPGRLVAKVGELLGARHA